MTTDELLAACAERRRIYAEHGFHGEPAILLTVPRASRYERMRVMPGVMGEVMSWNGNATTVRVMVADVEKALRRLAGAPEPKP